MRHQQVWVHLDPSNNFKKMKGIHFHFYYTFCSETFSTLPMPTTSSTEALTFWFLAASNLRHRENKSKTASYLSWTICAWKKNDPKKSWVLLDQFKAVTSFFLWIPVHSPGIFLSLYPLNINSLVENWTLSEGKDDKPFHLDNYQAFSPVDTSLLAAPLDSGCQVRSAPAGSGRTSGSRRCHPPPCFLLFRKFLNKKCK